MKNTSIARRITALTGIALVLGLTVLLPGKTAGHRAEDRQLPALAD